MSSPTVLNSSAALNGKTLLLAETSASVSGGLIPTADSVQVGWLLRKTVTIANAAIKTLPTTPVTIVTAPAAGFEILPVFGTLFAKTTAGAYTNINAAGFLQFEGDAVLSFVPNDAAITNGSATNLSDLLGGANNRTVNLFGWCRTENVNDWGPVGEVDTTAGATSLTLSIGNGGSGNLTGGNAANTLTIVVFYVIVAVP